MLNAGSAVDAYEGAGACQDGKIILALLARDRTACGRCGPYRVGDQNRKDLAGKKFIAKRRAMAGLKIADILLRHMAWIKECHHPRRRNLPATDALRSARPMRPLFPECRPVSCSILPKGESDILSIPDDKLKIVYSKLGSALHTGVIPANTYRGQNYEVKAPAMSAVSVVSADMPEESV